MVKQCNVAKYYTQTTQDTTVTFWCGTVVTTHIESQSYIIGRYGRDLIETNVAYPHHFKERSETNKDMISHMQHNVTTLLVYYDTRILV